MIDETRAALDRGAALLGAATVALANFKMLAGLPAILDPVTSMEPYYIDMASRPVSAIVTGDPAWGPLYGLWLKGFRAAFEDPLTVHAANVCALSVAVSLALYALLLLLTRRAAVATGGAMIFLVSDLNVPLPSKVCSFALLVVVTGLAVAELAPRGRWRLAVTAGAVVLASYARPEFFPAGMCIGLAAIWQARRGGPRRALTWLSAGSVALAVMVAAVGTPVWSPHHEGGRLFGAFREHFAWNWVEWNRQHLYYAAIWERVFGEADGIAAALLANPTAFARHVIENFAASLRFVAGGAFAHFPLLVPPEATALAWLENVALAAAALAAVAVVAIDGERRRRAARRFGHLALPLAALAAFPLAGAALIFPAPHYLAPAAIVVLVVAVLAAVLLIPAGLGGSVPGGRRAKAVRLAAALAAVAVVPTPFSLPAQRHQGQAAGWQFTGQISVARKITDTVAQVRGLELPPPVHVLTFTDGIGELMGEGFEEIKIWGRGEQSLEEYVRSRHVDVIVTMERGRDSFLVDDPYWHLIETEPAKAGFTRLPTGDPRAVRVYIRSSLLNDD